MSINPIDPANNVALMASAGTGKTFNLALRAVTALMQGKTASVPLYDMQGGEVVSDHKVSAAGRVMCLTFTRKATAEMGKRVNEYLEKLAAMRYTEDDAEYSMVALALGVGSRQEAARMAAAARNRLFKDPRLLRISTIDAFMATVLRLFPFEADCRPDFEIIGNAETKQLEKDAIRLTFASFPEKEKYHQLFRRYIIWQDLQLKDFTDTIASGVNWTLENYIVLESLLLDAPSVYDLLKLMQQAEDNDKDIQDILKGLLSILFSPETEPALDKRQSKRHAALLSFTTGSIDHAKLCDSVVALSPEKAVNKKYELPESYHALYRQLEEKIGRYVHLFSGLSTGMILHMASRAFLAFNKLKEELAMLTFGDITRIVHHLMSGDDAGISNEHLYFRLDGKLEHIMIDEFQDTSQAQWDVLRPLADESMAGVSQYDRPGSFFCVGDSKQAIYRFRGAVPGFMGSLAKVYHERLKYTELTTNHRSDINVVNTANLLFTDADDFISGGDELRFGFSPQKAHSKEEGYVKICLAVGENAAQRVDARLKLLGEALAELTSKGYRPQDIAVIVTKKSSGVAAHNYMKQMDLMPSSLEFSEYLSDRTAYKIVESLVDYIHTGNKFCLAAFLLTPPAIDTIDGVFTPEQFEKYKNHIDAHLKDTEGQSIYRRIFSLGGTLSLTDRLGAEPDFAILLDLIAGRLSNEKNPLVFMQRFEQAASETRGGKSRGGTVSILTVHGAKGLEFPATILFDIKEKFDMHQNTKLFIDTPPTGATQIYKRLNKGLKEYASPEYLNALMREQAFIRFEKINQLYVAVTRAKHAMYIIVDNDEKESTDTYLFSHLHGTGSMGGLNQFNAKKDDLKEQHKDEFTLYSWNVLLPEINGGEPSHRQYKLPDGILKRGEQFMQSRGATAESTDTATGVEPYSSRYYGILLHEAIYHMSSFCTERVDAALSKAWRLHGGYLHPEMLEKCRADLISLASNAGWHRLIQNAEIFREKAISLKGELMVVDMFAIDGEEIRVFDFKTASPDTRREPEYIEQVDKYRRALSVYYSLPAKGFLIYIHSGDITIQDVP